MPPHVYFLVLLLSTLLVSAAGTTVRYRSGYLQGDSLDVQNSVTVAQARENCRRLEPCVSFAFQSPSTRFPAFNVTAYFYAYADWHASTTGEPVFVEDAAWHSYVNVTREREAVPREVETVLELLSGNAKLRGGGPQTMQRKQVLLESLFNIVVPKEHKAVAAPLLVPYLVGLSASNTDDPTVRQAAMRTLVVIADTSETGPVLFDAGVFQAMEKIVNQRKEGGIAWDETCKTALDVISNICLYRSVNEALREAGAISFLRDLLSEPGFPGLQAAMAFTHIGIDIELPKAKIQALVQLLRNAIDGDIAYGINWDLIPGPLSATKYLALHSKNIVMYEQMLDAGLMEQLLRVLESDCLQADEVEAALEIMQSLSLVSERARHMILLAEHALHDTEARLLNYNRAAELASGLSATVARFDSSRSEL